MIRKKDLLKLISKLECNIEKLRYEMAWLDNRTRTLCDYADHFDALVNHLELDFEKIPAIGEKIKVIKKKK